MGVLEKLKTNRRARIATVVVLAILLPYITIPTIIIWWFCKTPILSKRLKIIIGGIFAVILLIYINAVSRAYRDISSTDNANDVETLLQEHKPEIEQPLEAEIKIEKQVEEQSDDVKQPLVEEMPFKYEILFTDEDYRYDDGKSYEVVIDPIDLSDDSFKENIEAIVDDMVSKYGTKISITIFDNREICEHIYNLRQDGGGILDKEMLEKRAVHLIASFDGEIETMIYANTLMYFPGAFTDNPVVGKYVSTVEYNPQPIK